MIFNITIVNVPIETSKKIGQYLTNGTIVTSNEIGQYLADC